MKPWCSRNCQQHQQGRWSLQPQGPQRFERRLSRIPRIPTRIPTGIPGPAARGMAGLLPETREIYHLDPSGTLQVTMGMES